MNSSHSNGFVARKIEFVRLGLRLTKENLNDTVKIVSVVSGEICCAQSTQTI